MKLTPTEMLSLAYEVADLDKVSDKVRLIIERVVKDSSKDTHIRLTQCIKEILEIKEFTESQAAVISGIAKRQAMKVCLDSEIESLLREYEEVEGKTVVCGIPLTEMVRASRDLNSMFPFSKNSMGYHSPPTPASRYDEEEAPIEESDAYVGDLRLKGITIVEDGVSNFSVTDLENKKK